MLCQDLAVPLGAELVQQLGRPLHVAEEEGDCSRWKIALHSTTSCASTVATSGADVERAGATGLRPAKDTASRSGRELTCSALPHLCHTPPRVVSSTADRRELGHWAASGKGAAGAAPRAYALGCASGGGCVG